MDTKWMKISFYDYDNSIGGTFGRCVHILAGSITQSYLVMAQKNKQMVFYELGWVSHGSGETLHAAPYLE